MTKLYDWEKLFYGTTVAYPPAGWNSPLRRFNLSVEGSSCILLIK